MVLVYVHVFSLMGFGLCIFILLFCFVFAVCLRAFCVWVCVSFKILTPFSSYFFILFKLHCTYMWRVIRVNKCICLLPVLIAERAQGRRTHIKLVSSEQMNDENKHEKNLNAENYSLFRNHDYHCLPFTVGQTQTCHFSGSFFSNNNNNIPCIVELLKINLKLWEKTMFQCV